MRTFINSDGFEINQFYLQFTPDSYRDYDLQFDGLHSFVSYRFWFRRAEKEALINKLPHATKSLRHKDAQSKENQ